MGLLLNLLNSYLKCGSPAAGTLAGWGLGSTAVNAASHAKWANPTKGFGFTVSIDTNLAVPGLALC